MSAVTRLPAIAAVSTTIVGLVSITQVPAARQAAERYLGQHGLKYLWRMVALFAIFTNLKNIPGFWHIRVLRGILYQLYWQFVISLSSVLASRICAYTFVRPSIQQPKHLFSPLITSSYNTLYDCDYNFHKSNSTYFGDLDVARAHLVGCLIRTGLARLNRGDEEGLPADAVAAKGKYFVALGAVSCFFHRQIEPLQSFEIYTRLLAWDRKWLYLVSHIVRKGVIKPTSYTLQPWKKSSRRSGEAKVDDKDLQKHIFATSVARYCFKKGRMTISPEIVLQRSRLLPPRPDGVGLPPRGESVAPTPSIAATPAPTAANGVSADAVAAAVSSKLKPEENLPPQAVDDEWTWDDMERERLRGLQIASHFEALSAASGELRAGDVLGQYGDYW